MSIKGESNMDRKIYTININGASPADISRYAEELRDVLLDVTPDIEVHRRRDNPYTLDFGATLVLILGAPTLVSIANALGNWLKLRNSASLTIETSDKKIVAQNITSQDAAGLAHIFLEHEREGTLESTDSDSG
jgi:hypothetical protein